MRTWITVERGNLRFFAAHMATFRGQVEPLHGHNYTVLVEAAGPLTEDAWVVDFGYVKQAMKRLCDGLDHKFLLQEPSELLYWTEREDSYELIAERHRRYVFPKTDVLPLPIRNSTAEQIAGWLHGQLCAELRLMGIETLQTITIGVEEAPGQTGWYAATFPGAGAGGTV
jgi:6-pyruvoyltetrahydropterin/6-carboxytetrahydropterin synthase